MAYMLKPEMLSKMTSVADVKKLMKQDLKNAAGKEVKFVAAKNWKIGPTRMNLFIVTDKPTSFEALIKKAGATLASGTASVEVEQGKTKIVVKKSTGAIDDDAIAEMVGLTVGDPAVVATTQAKEKERAQAEQEESDKAKRPKPDALKMAKASHAQAIDAGKLDRPDFKPDTKAVTALAEASRQMPEFKRFKGNFDKFMSDYSLSNDGKMPTDIWNKLFLGLVKSDYKYTNKDIEKAPDGRFKLRVDGPMGQLVREKTLDAAMKGLQPFVDHAGRYLDMVVQKANSGKTWAFWSGTGAEDAAKGAGGVSLEGTVGSFFNKYQDEWINWKSLIGDVATIPLWTSLSEMYAKKGAEYIAKYKFIGFVGPGATNDNNVFNNIEQPTFIEVLTVKMALPKPNIEWFVVDCASDNKGGWNPTGNKPTQFSDREAALAEVVKRYGK